MVEAHQQRVVDEKRELDVKLEKLVAFFDTETYQELDSEERYRLRRQANAMYSYSKILGERIAAFK